jgi:hypothetical protein
MVNKKDLVKKIKEIYPIELDTKKLNALSIETLQMMLDERLKDMKLLNRSVAEESEDGKEM